MEVPWTGPDMDNTMSPLAVNPQNNSHVLSCCDTVILLLLETCITFAFGVVSTVKGNLNDSNALQNPLFSEVTAGSTAIYLRVHFIWCWQGLTLYNTKAKYLVYNCSYSCIKLCCVPVSLKKNCTVSKGTYKLLNKIQLHEVYVSLKEGLLYCWSISKYVL